MSIAPFIRPIHVQGGTFYSFSSAAEDLGLTFNSSGKKFSFSKYALLDIPDIKRPAVDVPNHENYVQLDAIPGAFQYINNSKTYNTMFAESFQNYCLNVETMVTSQAGYDASSMKTVSERVFFKWMKEIGALRFREASTSTEAPLSAGLRFTEEDASTYYNRVVKYIGEIDMVNSVKSKDDTYSEIYINVPTKDGSTPLILFKSFEDENYYPGLNMVNNPSDPLDTEFLYGRSYDEEHPASIDTHAFFDSDTGNYGIGGTVGATVGSLPTITTPGDYQLLQYDTDSETYKVGWWFSYPEANSYWTQPEALSGSFDDPSNDAFMLRGVKVGSVSSTDTLFQRSRLDGICIDFDTSNYVPISTNPSIKSFSDFNGIPETVSFQFNTILVYYTVEDISTGDTETNLFGVLFLDDVQDTLSSGSYIPRLQKYKPNRTTGLNGNAYGFKVNVKFDISSGEASIVTAVNEYAPFSLYVFLDALNRLKDASDMMVNNQFKTIELSQRIEQLESLITGGTEIEEILAEIASIQTQLEAAGLMLENSESLSTLIDRNYQEILNIYQNYTSVAMSYNLDVLKQGEGVLLDKAVPNEVTISNTRQGFTLGTSPVVNILTDFVSGATAWTYTTKLNPFDNYLKISSGTDLTLLKDIEIYIDDTDQRWKNGQTIEIVIDRDYPIDMYTEGSFDLVVFTDAIDRLSTGENYSKEIGRISSSVFFEESGYPKLRIICLNKDTYTFTYDIL
jgi:hypothetical protein